MPSTEDRHFLSLAGAAGVGAAAMYFLDPARGSRRRHTIADQVVRTRNVVGEGVRTTSRDLRNRAVGVAARARRRLANDPADDDVIAERLRAELGHVVSHPSAIDVSVEDGRATLAGIVLAHEVEALLARARSVRGVRDVVDRLERHESAEDVPGLQGEGRGPDASWSRTARLVAVATGSALVVGGLAGRDRLGATGGGVLGLVGLALLARGVVDEPLGRLTGLGARRGGVRVRRAIDIVAPADVVFDYVTDWERWPEWMPNVHEVVRTHARSDGELGERTHWEVDGPAGTTVAWDAVVTRFVDNESVSWRSTPDAAIQHAGTLQLLSDGFDRTRLRIELWYDPPAGAVGDLVATIFGRDPSQQAKLALERLKSVVETGVTPHETARRARERRVWSGPRKWQERFR